MRRRITLTAAAAGLLLLLTGCSGALDTGTGTAPNASDGGIPRPAACDEENPFIAVALPNLTNPYYVAMKQGFEEQGEEQGFDVEVQVANDDDAAQLSQVQSMLQKKPCALALNAVKSEPAAATASPARTSQSSASGHGVAAWVSTVSIKNPENENRRKTA